ncbi:MAG: ADP-ribosylglycohydrolase family protein [Anaerolineaceae bacterium]|nr:ADP-ribosylglycohydrolase family protein [Anaerolineaceae bacterium]
MNINRQEYRDKVLACWLGKSIGGTLGEPFEWRRQLNDIDFYVQDLGGEPRPNDDLDIQLLWLIALEEQGIDIDAKTLGEYWMIYVTPHWSEYGNAKANMRAGLLPPLSGTYNNDYKDSCGAFIRSEIWACIAPGNPQLAARYAYEDAIIDHGNGEGTYAEVFTAALESAAFVESDIDTLIDIALSYIPADCGVAGAVRLAQECYRGGLSWVDARDRMLEEYRGSAFFGMPWTVSQRDTEKGFDTGKLGWDVPSNIGMLLIGLLYGEGDFDKTITTAVNCGEDTDCTGATVGSLFGILHGTAGISERWIEPIGHKIVTACLNKGELGFFGATIPGDVDNLTERTEKIALQVIRRKRLPIEVTNEPTDLEGLSTEKLMAGREMEDLYLYINGPKFENNFLRVGVDYGKTGPLIRDGQPKQITLHIRNTYKVQASLKLHWHADTDWQISPSRDGALLCLQEHFQRPLDIPFTITIDRVRGSKVSAVVELANEGFAGTLLVPIVLLNGNLQ